MSFESLMVHEVTVSRPATGVDRWGNPTKNWAAAVTFNMRAWVAQNTTSEVTTEGREAELSQWLMLYAPGTAVAHGDRVFWSGLTFEVAGHPRPAWTSRAIHHYEVPLNVVEG